jgi:hypothetical protein
MSSREQICPREQSFRREKISYGEKDKCELKYMHPKKCVIMKIALVIGILAVIICF